MMKNDYDDYFEKSFHEMPLGLSKYLFKDFFKAMFISGIIYQLEKENKEMNKK